MLSYCAVSYANLYLVSLFPALLLTLAVLSPNFSFSKSLLADRPLPWLQHLDVYLLHIIFLPFCLVRLNLLSVCQDKKNYGAPSHFPWVCMIFKFQVF